MDIHALDSPGIINSKGFKGAVINMRYIKKRLLAGLLALLMMVGGLSGCAARPQSTTQVLATTAPVWAMTCALLQDTGLQCDRLVTESVSCLHDYTLTVSQMEKLERADVVVLNGLGLEAFMEDALLAAKQTITAADGVQTLPGEDGADPHIWLEPQSCIQMCQTIAAGLCAVYPDWQSVIERNLSGVIGEYQAAQAYGEEALRSLSCRSLVTFHDGFSYFARAFDLDIAAAMEIEEGSEPSARELERIVRLIEDEQIPAVFYEENGARQTAETVARQTGAALHCLTTGMGEGEPGCTDAIYQNINTIREALG